MLTALQSAKIKTASNLTEAREALLRTPSSVLWNRGEGELIHEMISRIDTLIGRIITNEELP
jgi:hypothetical protein